MTASKTIEPTFTSPFRVRRTGTPNQKSWGDTPDHKFLASHKMNPFLLNWRCGKTKLDDDTMWEIADACVNGLREKFGTDFQLRRVEWEDQFGFITLLSLVGLSENKAFQSIGEYNGNYFLVHVECFFDYQAVQIVLEEVEEHRYFSHIDIINGGIF